MAVAGKDKNIIDKIVIVSNLKLGGPSTKIANGIIIKLALVSMPVAAIIGLTPLSLDRAQMAATAYEKHANIRDNWASERKLKLANVSKPITMHTPMNAKNNPIS